MPLRDLNQFKAALTKAVQFFLPFRVHVIHPSWVLQNDIKINRHCTSPEKLLGKIKNAKICAGLLARIARGIKSVCDASRKYTAELFYLH